MEMTIAEAVKETIKKSGFKVESLAKKMGLEPSTVYRWMYEESEGNSRGIPINRVISLCLTANDNTLIEYLADGVECELRPKGKMPIDDIIKEVLKSNKELTHLASIEAEAISDLKLTQDEKMRLKKMLKAQGERMLKLANSL